MKRLTILLTIAIAVATLLTWFGATNHLELKAETWRVPQGSGAPVHATLSLPLHRQVSLKVARGDSIRLTLASGAANLVTTVTVRATGGIGVAAEENANQRSRECPSQAPRTTVCSLAIRVGAASQTVATIYALDRDVTVTGIQSEVAVAHEQAAATGPQLLYGFAVLLLLGPLLAWLGRWPGMDRNALVLLGLAWVSITGWQGLLINAAFALGGYVLISRVRGAEARKPSTLLLAIVAVTLVLIFVKFVAPSVAAAFANPGGFALALPLGVSYFAIRIIDLVFTAHSGTLRPVSLRDYLAFLFMPHTLPAGPIMTYQEFLQSRKSSYSVVDFAAGAARMAVGLTKKLAADAFLLPVIGHEMISFLDGGTGNSPVYIAAMLVLNTIYVYLDFSAYCDLAIGAGRAAGYTIPENFDWPLLRSGMRQFWQSWHMTLTRWVMRRVYFPAFLSSRSITLSMFAAMLVIGLWHAADISWALWAVHHMAALATQARLAAKRPAIAASAVAPQHRFPGAVRYAAGVAFVWIWVSLGHSFTMFSAPDQALRCYLMALALPWDLVHRATALF